eukprot:380391-Prymnesium_polylepis.1
MTSGAAAGPTQINAATQAHAEMVSTQSLAALRSNAVASPTRTGAATTSSQSATSPSQIGAPTASGSRAAVGPPIAARHTTGRLGRPRARAA